MVRFSKTDNRIQADLRNRDLREYNIDIAGCCTFRLNFSWYNYNLCKMFLCKN